MLPDLLLVEFAANDYADAVQSGVWPLGNDTVSPSATVNMQRLLRHMWAHYTTAPLLLLTTIRGIMNMSDPYGDSMSSIEPVYEAATHEHAIPLLSVRQSIGLPSDKVSPAGLFSLQKSTAEYATAEVWHTHLFKDHAHFTSFGQTHVAIIITAYLNRFITRLMSTIETGRQQQRQAGRPNSADIYPSSIVLGAEAVVNSTDTGGGICSIRWGGYSTLHKELIGGEAVVENSGWSYKGQLREKDKVGWAAERDKVGWSAHQRGASIVFDLALFGNASQHAQLVSCSVTYLRSYADDMGKAIVWVEAESAHGKDTSRHNVTDARLLDGRWSLHQSTLVVVQLPFHRPSLDSISGSNPKLHQSEESTVSFRLHVVSGDDDRFVLAGISVDFA